MGKTGEGVGGEESQYARRRVDGKFDEVNTSARPLGLAVILYPHCSSSIRSSLLFSILISVVFCISFRTESCSSRYPTQGFQTHSRLKSQYNTYDVKIFKPTYHTSSGHSLRANIGVFLA